MIRSRLPEMMANLAGEMRRWYFREGGIFLSSQSRPPYFKLKELLDKTVKSRNESTGPVEPDTLKKIIEAGSEVRRVLAADVGTRKEPLLSDN